MDVIEIYAITLGCILFLILFGRFLAYFIPWSIIALFFSRHFAYPYVIQRRSFVGPWTRLGTFMNISYVSIIIFMLFFKSESSHTLSHRAGSLTLINLIFLVASFSLSRTADLLGITLKTTQRGHRAVGWVVLMLSIIHVSLTLTVGSEDPIEVPTDATKRLFGSIVSFLKFFRSKSHRLLSYLGCCLSRHANIAFISNCSKIFIRNLSPITSKYFFDNFIRSLASSSGS